jgi:photosystem II stability/assembly factor-like uncharacterized protein
MKRITNVQQAKLHSKNTSGKQKFIPRMAIQICTLCLFFLFTSTSEGQNKAIPENKKENKSNAVATSLVNTILQSTDAGKSWNDIRNLFPENVKMWGMVAQGKDVYLRTSTGEVYHNKALSTDPWTKENIKNNLPEKSIMQMCTSHSAIYVCFLQGGFFRKKIGMPTWESIPLPAKEKFIYDIIENLDGSLVVTSLNGMYRSTNNGNSWQQVFSKACGDLEAKGNTIICNASDGLIRSADAGKHWEYVLGDEGGIYNVRVINNQFVAIRVAGEWHRYTSDNPWLTFAYNIPLRISTDDGKTWQRLDVGLLPIQSIQDVVQVGKYLFCSHSKGISRSADGGKSWELMYAIKNNSVPSVRIDLMIYAESILAIFGEGGC